MEAAEAAIEAEAAAEAAAVKQKAALAALMAGKAAEEAKEASAAQKAASRIAAMRRGQKARRPSRHDVPRPLFVPKGIPAAWAALCKVRSAPVLLPAARLLALITQVYEAKMVSDAACEKEGRPKPPFEQLCHFTLQCEGVGQASSK